LQKEKDEIYAWIQVTNQFLIFLIFKYKFYWICFSPEFLDI
jgi:hypothetical protein